MDFEYDPAKSRTNAIEHGIDFEAARRLLAPDRPPHQRPMVAP
jgi:uncharacterized DUF497 family protein